MHINSNPSSPQHSLIQSLSWAVLKSTFTPSHLFNNFIGFSCSDSDHQKSAEYWNVDVKSLHHLNWPNNTQTVMPSNALLYLLDFAVGT